MRVFVAIELPGDVHDALGELQGRLRGLGIRASWVKQGNIHLTLRFLGEIGEEQAGHLVETLGREYAGVERFTLRVQGAGAFPNARRPSVLWAGCGPVEGALAGVQRSAEFAARSSGLEPEMKAFHPHLTLGRVRDWRAAGPVAEALERESGFDGGEFEAAGVALFQSRLSRAGAEYERIEEFRFC